MRTQIRTLATLGAAVLLLAGCVGGSDSGEDTGIASQAVTVANGRGLNGRGLNGRGLNGRGLNGRGLNGRGLNGRGLNGVSLNSVHVAGAELADVSLDATRFRATSQHGAVGHAFVGAVFTGILDDGTTLPLRIDSMMRDKDMGDGVYSYSVSYETMDGWLPLCLDSEGAPVRAIPLSGMWNYGEGVEGGGSFIDEPNTFTFACGGFALAKCVELGYEPWARAHVCNHQKGCTWTSLAPYHQACTRLLRADYCGDGTSYTVDGTVINLYDAIGIQADTEEWAFEAEWDANGATCVARERIAAVPAPPCWSKLLTPGCGAQSDFVKGALLMSEDNSN